MTGALLSATGVSRAVGAGRRPVRVVDGVTLDLVPGEIAAVVGAHGAGKTTLLRVLAGQLRPDAGAVQVGGYPADSVAARRLLGYAPDQAVFPPALRVREILEYFARLHGPGVARRGAVARALALAGLDAVADRRVGALTPGDQGRLAFAQAALGGRRVLLLDEPFRGLDAAGRAALGAALQALALSGAALLVSLRDATGVERIATRALLLHQGRVVAQGAVGPLVARRVLELVLDPPRPPAAAPPGLRVTPAGLEAELSGTSVEAVLALCRAHRLAVRASRVREGTLEDALRHAAAGSNAEGGGAAR